MDFENNLKMKERRMIEKGLLLEYLIPTGSPLTKNKYYRSLLHFYISVLYTTLSLNYFKIRNYRFN